MKNYITLILCSFLITSHTIHASAKNNYFHSESLEFTSYPEQKNVTKDASSQTCDQNRGTSSPNHLSNMFAQYAKISDSSKNEQKFSSQAKNNYENGLSKNHQFSTRITIDSSNGDIKVNGTTMTGISPYDNLS